MASVGVAERLGARRRDLNTALQRVIECEHGAAEIRQVVAAPVNAVTAPNADRALALRAAMASRAARDVETAVAPLRTATELAFAAEAAAEAAQALATELGLDPPPRAAAAGSPGTVHTVWSTEPKHRSPGVVAAEEAEDAADLAQAAADAVAAAEVEEEPLGHFDLEYNLEALGISAATLAALSSAEKKDSPAMEVLDVEAEPEREEPVVPQAVPSPPAPRLDVVPETPLSPPQQLPPLPPPSGGEEGCLDAVDEAAFASVPSFLRRSLTLEVVNELIHQLNAATADTNADIPFADIDALAQPMGVPTKAAVCVLVRLGRLHWKGEGTLGVKEL